MAKRGRPFEYDSDTERPVTVSLRIPRDLYNRMETYRRMHQQSITELLLDGLRLRLETPADPRDIVMSDDNTVIQELQEMVDARVLAALERIGGQQHQHFSLPEAPVAHMDQSHFGPSAAWEVPMADLSHYDNTVLQSTSTQPRGRPSGPMRHRILTLLSHHPEGLTAEQIRGQLTPERPIGDTLQGMRKSGVVRIEVIGKHKRYFVASKSA